MADALTDDEFVLVREYVGSRVEETRIQDAYDRKETLKGAALEILKIQRADYIMNPAQFQISGKYGQNTGKNIEALDELIAKVEAQDDDLSLLDGGGTAILCGTRRYPR